MQMESQHLTCLPPNLTELPLTFEKTLLATKSNLIFPTPQYKTKSRKFREALLDFGASAHMFGNLMFFVKGTLEACYKRIECADGKFLFSYWKGTVLFIRNSKLPATDPSNVIVCNNSLLVEGISKHLVSVSVLTSDGYSVEFVNDLAKISSKENEQGKRTVIYSLKKAVEHDKLYHFPFITSNDVSTVPL